jgi:hypothetical protein
MSLVGTSCNVFDVVDSPTSEAQLLSGARACLDNQDYECAAELYGKLAESQPDLANAELAYSILEKNGAGFGEFAAAFGSSPDPSGLNKLANSMAAKGASQSRRLALYDAYAAGLKMTAGTSQRSLVLFLSSAAIAAEILAEAAGSDAQITKSDLVANATSCTTDQPACLVNSACDAGNDKLTVAASNDDLDAGAPTGDIPSDSQLYDAAIKASNGLNAVKGTQSGGSLSGLAGTAGKPTVENVAKCFRANLIHEGIGG